MFVGDSLNRGQWISMLCLLQSTVPANKRSITPQAQLTTFRAEVKCTPINLWCISRFNFLTLVVSLLE